MDSCYPVYYLHFHQTSQQLYLHLSQKRNFWRNLGAGRRQVFTECFPRSLQELTCATRKRNFRVDIYRPFDLKACSNEQRFANCEDSRVQGSSCREEAKARQRGEQTEAIHNKTPPALRPPASRVVTQQLNNFPAPKFAASYKLHATNTLFPQNSGPQSPARIPPRYG
jgi:hypothetical protein